MRFDWLNMKRFQIQMKRMCWRLHVKIRTLPHTFSFVSNELQIQSVSVSFLFNVLSAQQYCTHTRVVLSRESINGRSALNTSEWYPTLLWMSVLSHCCISFLRIITCVCTSRFYTCTWVKMNCNDVYLCYLWRSVVSSIMHDLDHEICHPNQQKYSEFYRQ